MWWKCFSVCVLGDAVILLSELPWRRVRGGNYASRAK